MKKIGLFVLLFLILLVSHSWGYGIVNNSGTSPEDSLTVAVACLDSLGCPANCDSFFIVVFKAGTNAVVFRDSGTIAMTGMDSTAIAGITYYYFHRATADIDDGVVGQYSGFLIAKENSPLLLTPNRFDFQITSLELDDQLIEIANVLDTLQNHDDWVSSYDPSSDSVTVDKSNLGKVPINLDDVTGTLSDAEVEVITVTLDDDSLQQLMDDVDNVKGNAQAILDTLQAYDAAGHILANVQAILDSIKLYDETGRFSVEVNTKTGFKLAADGLDADTSFDQVQGKTDALPADPADDSDIDGQLANIQTEVDNMNGWTPPDSFTIDKSNAWGLGVKIFGMDAAVYDTAAHENYDTMLTHADDFKGSSSIPDSTAGDISDMANRKAGVLTDSVSDATKSYLAHVNYDSMLIHADDFQSDGDTNTYDLGSDGVIVTTNNDKTGYSLASTSFIDSVNNAIADANKVNFKADVDSANNALADANKGNFKADVDSVNNAVADANKSNFMATGFATSADGDSVTQAIADANKGNFKATGFATTSECDSIEAAIADANKGNFKATIPDSSRAYLATHDSTLLEQAASAGAGKIIGMDAAVYDSIAHEVYDTMLTHAADFKYAGGADSVRAYLATHDSTLLEAIKAGSDSTIGAIADANKENFKYGGGADSVRGYLATHDSTLLETAANCTFEDTIWIIQTDTGSVPSPNLTKVKGFTRTYGFRKTDRVTVTFTTHETNLRDTTTGTFVDRTAETVYADTGYFEIDLIASLNLISDVRGAVKDSIRYDVELSTPGRTIFSRTGILVPISATPVWLQDILED